MYNRIKWLVRRYEGKKFDPMFRTGLEALPGYWKKRKGAKHHGIKTD
jgi:hypothetical protein